MKNLVIRGAVPEDAEALLDYLNRVGGESDNLLFGENEMQIPVERERTLIEMIGQSPRDCMLVGLDGAEIVAVASLQGNGRPRIAHRGSIALSVRKSHWRRGVGTRMMEALLEFADGAGISVLELEVRTDNVRAIALYERMGFTVAGTYRKFFRLNSRYFDAYLMQRDMAE